MKIVTVIPLKRGVWKEELTYFTTKEIQNGNIVNIPLRGKNTLGLAISIKNASEIKGDIKDLSFSLKKIEEVKGYSIWRKEFLDSSILASQYFGGKVSQGIASLIPNIFLEEYDSIVKFKNEKLKISENELLNIANENKLKAEKLIFQAPFKDRITYYKTLIRTSFADKKSVFIVLPTERDVEIFENTLFRGVEKYAFSFHGGKKPKKILEQYKDLIQAPHPVLIVGTAPFLSIPRNDIATIILEHESSTAYKGIARPHIDLRTFTEIFASSIKAKLIIADTFLRFDTIGRKEIDGLTEIHPFSYRMDFSGEIIVSGKYHDEKNILNRKFKILSDQSLNKIKESIEKGKNVFIFSLRKGLATYTVCRDCGEPLMCDLCQAPVVLYFSKDGIKRMFACNRCNTEKNPETKCTNCGSWNLTPYGIGTDTVYEYLKEFFKEEEKQPKIFKLDKETVKTASGAKKIIQEFENHPGSILVGTEMSLFYLKENISLSVVASFDSLWSIPNFRMSEKIIQLLNSIMEKTDKTLLIETKNESDPIILSIIKGTLSSFIREELKDRQEIGYPPYKRFIKITFTGDKQQTMEAKRNFKEFFSEYNPDIFSGFISKIKDKYVTNALIKLNKEEWTLDEISDNGNLNFDLLKKLMELPPAYDVLVDPEDLL